jgi:hypothetical protein
MLFHWKIIPMTKLFNQETIKNTCLVTNLNKNNLDTHNNILFNSISIYPFQFMCIPKSLFLEILLVEIKFCV